MGGSVGQRFGYRCQMQMPRQLLGRHECQDLAQSFAIAFMRRFSSVDT
ncbi:hypothetical protein DES41_111234 [Pseudorhodoferax soli]|uniref:Uncharacterized protein n=1 Tax=Pseudorhodoferax soli TaxID=545864 RepID=A0A368XGF7_9BURK|nr:hypothetical protein DES41_111234 [Pseudorhodoferax soli]